MPIRCSGRYSRFRWTDSGAWTFARGFEPELGQAVSGNPIPETDLRADWPRLVAKRVNDSSAKVSALESRTVSRAKGRFVYG